MADRGLSPEEIALAKGMIELGMRRDIIHSFFVSPGNPLTPAFVAELQRGVIGARISAASRDETVAFINSRVAFSTTVSRRGDQQLDLFPEPPANINSPHRFAWDNARLVRHEYSNYTNRQNAEIIKLLDEARFEIGDLADDPAIGNHPRLKRRVQRLLEALPKDVAKLDPVLAGARAKKTMQALAYSAQEFSDEFVGDLSASVSAVLMLVSHFPEWQKFELTTASAELSGSAEFFEAAEALVQGLQELPAEIIDPIVVESIAEFVSEAERKSETSEASTPYEPEVLAALAAAENYAAISTVSQLSATLFLELRYAGAKVYKFAEEIARNLREGVLDGVKHASTVITSALIVVWVFSQLKAASIASPQMLGWLKPFLDSIERVLFSK